MLLSIALDNSTFTFQFSSLWDWTMRTTYLFRLASQRTNLQTYIFSSFFLYSIQYSIFRKYFNFFLTFILFCIFYFPLFLCAKHVFPPLPRSYSNSYLTVQFPKYFLNQLYVYVVWVFFFICLVPYTRSLMPFFVYHSKKNTFIIFIFVNCWPLTKEKKKRMNER